MHRPGVELANSRSQVRRPNHYTTEPPDNDDDDDDDYTASDAAVMPLLFVALPTYEECTSGRVSILEDGDNKHVRGEMSWCPKYPMYRHLSVRQGPSAPPL